MSMYVCMCAYRIHVLCISYHVNHAYRMSHNIKCPLSVHVYIHMYRFTYLILVSVSRYDSPRGRFSVSFMFVCIVFLSVETNYKHR